MYSIRFAVTNHAMENVEDGDGDEGAILGEERMIERTHNSASNSEQGKKSLENGHSDGCWIPTR